MEAVRLENTLRSAQQIRDYLNDNLPRVHNQVVLLGKALTAFLADIGSLAGVELAVRDQVSL